MRFLVIGAGFGAAIHAPNIRGRADLQLVGICDSGSGRASGAVALGEVSYTNWRQAIDELAPSNAVIVATPPSTQNEIVSEALVRGLNVLVEKPAGVLAEEARGLAVLARQHGVVAAVNFQFRFEPLLDRMRRELSGGRIGKLRSIEVQWHTGGRANTDQRAEWRHFVSEGGGVLLSHFTHLIDLVRWLGGGEVSTLKGHFGTWVPRRQGADGVAVMIDAEDHGVCSFSTDIGIVGTMSVSNVQPGGDGLQVRVLAANGIAEFTHRTPFRPCDQRLVVHSADGSDLVALDGEMLLDTRAAAANRVLDLFVSAVRGDVSPDLPTMDQAANVLQVIELLRQKQKSGV